MQLFVDKHNEDRKKKAYKLEKPDRVPVCFSDQLDFLHGWLQLDCLEYHYNADVMLNAQIEFNKRFRGTGITGPNFGVALEPSAFGAKILFTKDNPPWVIEACKDFDRLEEYIDGLIDPDPRFSGYLPLFYQTYFFMNKMSDGGLPAPLGVLSSFDVASLLIGLDNLSLLLKLDSEMTHRLLGKINRFLINFIETKAQVFGVDKIDMIDIYGDNAGYISHEDFEEFVIPYNKRIYDYFSSEDTVRLYHCDGRLKHVIDLIPQMGCNCLYSFDPTTDLDEFVRAIGDKVCLMGNLDPIRVLRNQTPEVVKRECRRLIEIGKRAKGFILTTGGELANGTPPENIDAVFEALDEYGIY